MNSPLAEPANRLLIRICQEAFSPVERAEVYLEVSGPELSQVLPLLPDMGIILIALFAAENFNKHSGLTLFYVMEKRGSRNLVILVHKLEGRIVATAAGSFPSAVWFEREIRDGFGISFENTIDSRPLFLHEAYPANFHPLLKSFHNRTLDKAELRQVGNSYPFKPVEGEGVYNVLVGPVHAGIIEPGHFHFSVIGETIANLEVRLFYKHRGIEKLAEGQNLKEGLVIAESISGDESAANALAYCLAVEKIAGVTIPQRAWMLRTILLEMERIYAHLGDISGMLVDVAFALGAAEFGILREDILRFNAVLSGSRFLKGVIVPGGLKRDIPDRELLRLNCYLEVFIRKFTGAVDYVHKLDSVLDRFETTGEIKPELVNPLNISGPSARAAGIAIDTRVDHPYGIYSQLGIDVRTVEKGDGLGRFDIKTGEIFDSVALIQTQLADIKPMGDSAVYIKPETKDGYALSLVEAPRGQNLHWLWIEQGRIVRYKVRTASFCNWQAIEHAVIGNIVPDFPLINKSLNLSYAGTDL
jgi:Ni,Fe-hydrogenase III large subunit/Ni,Fe-hydrogenase III component G